MPKAQPPVITAPDTMSTLLAELDMPLFGLLVLVTLLLLITVRLSAVHALLLPEARRTYTLASAPKMLFRKGALLLYGSVFLLLSKDKVSKKQIEKAHALQKDSASVEREIRLIFIRHGESVWNYVFNRGFGPGFLVRGAADSKKKKKRPARATHHHHHRRCG